jgi:hypothetical protein
VIVVRDTSQGTIVMSFSYVTRSIGLAASIGSIDRQGWAADVVSWNSGAQDGRSLADAIVEAVPIPLEEAKELAESTLAQLHERGGDVSDMSRRDWLSAGARLTTTFGAILVLILILLAALVWIAIKVV